MSRHDTTTTDDDTGRAAAAADRPDPHAPKPGDPRPLWDYEVRLASGKVQVNEIAATDEEDARKQLTERFGAGATILSVEPA